MSRFAADRRAAQALTTFYRQQYPAPKKFDAFLVAARREKPGDKPGKNGRSVNKG